MNLKSTLYLLEWIIIIVGIIIVIPPGIVTKTNMGVPVWSFSDCTLGGQKGGRYLKNPFFCTTQQSFACWWIAPEIRLMLELIGRQYTEGKLFSVLEIKCSVSYSGKRGGHKGSSLAAISSKSKHPSRVCVVFCLRPVGYQICCWILYAIVSFKSRYVLNEKQLEM